MLARQVAGALGLAWVTAWSAPACDGGSSSPPVEVEGPSTSIVIEAGPMAPGEEWERCHLLKLDNAEPLYVQRIEARASGMHHLMVQTTGVDFPDAAEPCFSAPDRFMESGEAPRVLFSMATGAREAELSFPPGLGFRIEPYQQVMVDFHAINYHPEARDGSVVIDLFGVSAAEGEGLQEIGYAILNNTDVELPAGQEGTVVMQCEFPFDVDFISLASHMHMLGIASEVKFVGGARAGEIVHTSGDWNDGGMTVFSPPLRVAAGDVLEIRCDYAKNDATEPIVFGPSAAHEMCQIEGYVVGKDTVLGGTAPSIGIEECMLIRLDESNQSIYRDIIEVFSPGSSD